MANKLIGNTLYIDGGSIYILHPTGDKDKFVGIPTNPDQDDAGVPVIVTRAELTDGGIETSVLDRYFK